MCSKNRQFLNTKPKDTYKIILVFNFWTKTKHKIVPYSYRQLAATAGMLLSS
ncbi:hypothetical protein HMPREF9439_02025 [Parasutterella excrementihominis YIT 11859]|uniref:Uncharacterized protein n=1 Tax=Parasutterella excrementihominis YIT 11859 TaxID=762966 RepID=F3QM48_9BURK|nr:hypothetical protein HMPREF9439_02025 [Parasutterella excrementihominis YIT 11859]